MAEISESEILKLANLSKLTMAEEDYGNLLSELNKILKLIDKMNHVPTEHIIPLAHPTDEIQPLRNDSVTETDQREKFQRIAPQVEAGLYLVPPVIE